MTEINVTAIMCSVLLYITAGIAELVLSSLSIHVHTVMNVYTCTKINTQCMVLHAHVKYTCLYGDSFQSTLSPQKF